MVGCVGKELESEPEPEPGVDPEPAKKDGVNAASIVLVILVAGGGAVYFLKFRKKKPDVRGQDDLDDYDYGSEDEDESENDLEDETLPEGERNTTGRRTQANASSALSKLQTLKQLGVVSCTVRDMINHYCFRKKTIFGGR